MARLANTELQKIAETVDWLGLMSYDFAGPWSKTSGHNAPLFADPANPSPDAARNTVAAAVVAFRDYAQKTFGAEVLDKPYQREKLLHAVEHMLP